MILDPDCKEPVKYFDLLNARRTKNYVQWDTSGKGNNSQQNRAWYYGSKTGAIPQARAHGKLALFLGCNSYRRFNALEFERLQTLPEGYTNCVPKTYACGCIGNGWTIDIITHILRTIYDKV